MQFEGSTQSQSWMFSEESLRACREQSVSNKTAPPRGKLARKFASGFHQRFTNDDSATKKSAVTVEQSPEPNDSTQCLGVLDQETLIRFHAHQIQTLVGPNALLPELRRSATVQSTAVALFRRFYLSNSTTEVSPRKMAAACAFFASKLEEERVEISLLSHATALVQRKVLSSALCRQELAAVSISDIEAYETIMMEGVNYQFMCHHPHASIGFLVKDVASFLFEQKHPALDVDVASSSSSSTNDSTATTQTRPSSWDEFEVEEHANELLHRAMQVLHRANVFSDAPFLFAPGHIAFAIVAIVVESTNEGGFLGDIMQDYLVTRYPMQSEEEILEYTRNVSRVISLLLSNHNMDLRPRQNVSVSEIVAQRAAQLHRVLCRVRKMARQTAASQTATLVESRHRRKRTRSVADADFTPPRGLPVRKMVTPTY